MAQYWVLADDVDEEAADLISMHMSFCCSRDAAAGGGELRTSPSESERGARTMLLVVVVGWR